jgi:ribonuclease P protein component
VQGAADTDGRHPVAALATLRSTAEIRRVFATRTVVHGQAMSVHARAVHCDAGGVAVVAGRRVGGAVARNRAKRRLRAVLREGVPADLQLVVVAKPAALTTPFPVLLGEFTHLVSRVRHARSRPQIGARR